MKHFVSLMILLLLPAARSQAVKPTEEIRQMAGNYYAYPVDDSNAPKLIPTPEGYVPFHIEHYGRHGSRWHLYHDKYSKTVDYMLPAERNNKLTKRGKLLMEQLRKLEQQARGREGELTQKGARQHRGIGRRMTRNFPEVFADGAFINARSSVAVRCILSMANELIEIEKYNPNVLVNSDASMADMWYIIYQDSISKSAAKGAEKAVHDFNAAHWPGKDFIETIVSDRQFAKDSMQISKLRHNLMDIAFNAQSHDGSDDFFDLFEYDDIYNTWVCSNVNWYTGNGNSPLTDGLGPYSQRYLLNNIIASADTALVSGHPGANLRFGHEVVLLPLAVMLELGDYGKEIRNLNAVASKWRNYEIFPMAGNIQLIFYRPLHGDSPVMVKALLNEREVTLPAADQSLYPYYRWDDLRAYYKKKLERIPL